MCNLINQNNIENIYELLQKIDMQLRDKKYNYTKSLIRMAHVSLAMTLYGIENDHVENTDDVDPLIFMMRDMLTSETIRVGTTGIACELEQVPKNIRTA